MSTVSLTLPSDGDTIDASDVNNPLNAIAAVVNGGIDSTNISVGGITPANLESGTGSSWAWQSWTPTFVNWTIGTGGSAVTTAKYKQVGKTVFFEILSILGSSGQSVGTAPTFTLPVTSTAVINTDAIIGAGIMSNGAASGKSGLAYHATTTTAGLGYWDTNNDFNKTTAAGPFGWAAGNKFYLRGSYEAA